MPRKTSHYFPFVYLDRVYRTGGHPDSGPGCGLYGLSMDMPSMPSEYPYGALCRPRLGTHQAQSGPHTDMPVMPLGCPDKPRKGPIRAYQGQSQASRLLSKVHLTLIWANHGHARMKRGCPCPYRPRCAHGCPYQAHMGLGRGRYLGSVVATPHCVPLVCWSGACQKLLELSIHFTSRSLGASLDSNQPLLWTC